MTRLIVWWRSLPTLVAAGYVLAVLFAPVGLLIGLALMFRAGDEWHGVVIVCIAVVPLLAVLIAASS